MKKLFFFAFLLSMTGMQLLAAPRERIKLEQIASRKLATVMKKSQVKDNTIPQKVKPDVDADEDEAYIDVSFFEVPGEKAQLLLKSLALGLEQIEDEYRASGYIEVIYQEV